MTRPLLLATRNAHKTAEFRAMLAPEGWTVTDLLTHPGLPEVEETGETFAENAALKALSASGSPQLPPDTVVLADDSGLEVDALGGAPGVRSARYAGPGADDAANRRRLLSELARVGVLDAGPTARFRCSLALARGGALLATFDGAVEGTLLPAERGAAGFGYDALFVPAGGHQSFAELPAGAKNSFSHRARAMAAALGFLRGL